MAGGHSVQLPDWPAAVFSTWNGARVMALPWAPWRRSSRAFWWPYSCLSRYPGPGPGAGGWGARPGAGRAPTGSCAGAGGSRSGSAGPRPGTPARPPGPSAGPRGPWSPPPAGCPGWAAPPPGPPAGAGSAGRPAAAPGCRPGCPARWTGSAPAPRRRKPSSAPRARRLVRALSMSRSKSAFHGPVRQPHVQFHVGHVHHQAHGEDAGQGPEHGAGLAGAQAQGLVDEPGPHLGHQPGQGFRQGDGRSPGRGEGVQESAQSLFEHLGLLGV